MKFLRDGEWCNLRSIGRAASLFRDDGFDILQLGKTIQNEFMIRASRLVRNQRRRLSCDELCDNDNNNTSELIRTNRFMTPSKLK